MRWSSVAAGACSLALAATLIAAPAYAGGPPMREPDVLADGLVGPLSLAVGRSGKVIVNQSFAGTLSQVDRRGEVSALYQVPDPENGGIAGASSHHGAIYYLETSAGETGPVSHVVRLDRDGERTVVSDDFWAHETENNPDAGQTYGFRGLDDECAEDVAAFEDEVENRARMPLPLNEDPGIVESNAYQLTVHHGTIYVADAAANAILAVDEDTGEISTVAVLPASAITFSAEAQAYVEEMVGGLEMPDCVIGESYTPEPVPTDVEVGAKGRLFVSTLQGSAGEAFPLSKIYRINPYSGRTRLVADRGMQGVTGLAVSPSGHIVVAEMFDGAVSVIKPGSSRARTVFETESPADVELSGSRIYATTGVMGEDGAPGNGAVVTYKYRFGHGHGHGH